MIKISQRRAAPDLQVEAGALWHGVEGGDGGHAGERTHQDKDTPAVELIRRAHLEAPSCRDQPTTAMTSWHLKTALGPPN